MRQRPAPFGGSVVLVIGIVACVAAFRLVVPMVIVTLIALTAAVLALAFGFPMRAAARRLGWGDLSAERKTREKPASFGGGVALVIAIVASIVAARLAAPQTLGAEPRQWAIVAGIAISLAVGLWDDALGLRSWAKVAVQAAVGLLMWRAGFRAEIATNPFGGVIHLGVWGAALTVVWYVALMNAMSLIDGLDGLAAGVAAIAGVTILVISASWSQPSTALLSAIFVGACLGFLAHNFHPARLLLGNGGSMTLGFFLATLTLETGTKSSALLALMFPMVALLLPIADAMFAFTQRLAGGGQLSSGGRRPHLHDRLLRLGISHKRIVLILYYLSAINGVLAYLLAARATPGGSSSAPIAAVFFLQAAGFLLLIESLASLENRKPLPQKPGSSDKTPG